MTIPTNPEVGDQFVNDATGIIYEWSGDRWVILASDPPTGGGDGGVSKEYVDAQDNAVTRLSNNNDTAILNQLADKANVSDLDDYLTTSSAANTYVTTSNANSTYLRDGSTTNKLMISRTAGGSIDSMKVTKISGGASVWRLDAKAGTSGPVIYKTEPGAYHQFEGGKVVFERPEEPQQGFKIVGRKANGDIGELVYAYHNAGSEPDAFVYQGRITADNHVATKKYVDDAVAGTSTSSVSGASVADLQALTARVLQLEADHIAMMNNDDSSSSSSSSSSYSY